jgi:uncharacterized Zn finger protein
MARESRADKALRYIREERVEVVSANEHGIRLEVRGSKREPYQVAYGRDARGRLVTSCTCENGTQYHPVRPNCAHIEIAKLLRRE